MLRIKAKESAFFTLFNEVSGSACQAAEALVDLMKHYENVEDKIRSIKNIEHQCDQHVHALIELLHKSFITPIDREDIYMLAKELDDITDAINSTAYLFSMFNVQAVREDGLRLAELVLAGAKEVNTVVEQIRAIKRSSVIRPHIIEVNKIENEGDVVYRSAISKLFSSESDPIEIIKWKSIYEHLETALDACEEVANIADGVVMKHG